MNRDDWKITVRDKLNYYIALIAEFGKRYGLTNKQAYNYLNKYKGLDFAEKFYDVEHTLSFDEAVDDVTNYCRRMGGEIV